MSGHLGYFSLIREIEIGWGDRPDGCVLCLEKEKGVSFVETSDAFNHIKYPKEFSVAGDFKFCRLSEKAKEEIEKSTTGTIWIRPRDIDDYILET